MCSDVFCSFKNPFPRYESSTRSKQKKLPVRLNTSVATSTILQQPLVSLRSQASAGTVHIFHMVFKNDMGLSENRVLQHPTVCQSPSKLPWKSLFLSGNLGLMHSQVTACRLSWYIAQDQAIRHTALADFLKQSRHGRMDTPSIENWPWMPHIASPSSNFPLPWHRGTTLEITSKVAARAIQIPWYRKVTAIIGKTYCTMTEPRRSGPFSPANQLVENASESIAEGAEISPVPFVQFHHLHLFCNVWSSLWSRISKGDSATWIFFSLAVHLCFVGKMPFLLIDSDRPQKSCLYSLASSPHSTADNPYDAPIAGVAAPNHGCHLGVIREVEDEVLLQFLLSLLVNHGKPW